MTKLPRAAIATTAFSRDSSTQLYYTEAQMLQFRRDALDEAANAIVGTYAGISAVMCSNLVRKLKDET